MNKPFDIRINAVRKYLNNKKSLRDISKDLGIPYQTLHRWVKWYKTEGVHRLEVSYKRPWDRTKIEIEEKIALLKENDPGLTIKKAKKILEKEGVKISLKGIWGIWKRYGLAGFIRENFSGNFRDYIEITPEAKERIKQAKARIEQGELKQAAKIVNTLPFCGDAEILAQIPDRLLQSKKKLEKFRTLFGKIPFPIYLQKARNLKKMLFKIGYVYSGLRAAIEENRALAWMGRYEEEMALTEEIEKLMEKIKNKKTLMPLPLLICLSKGITYTLLLQIDKATFCLNKCKKYSRYIKSPFLLKELANFYSSLAFYSEAESLIQRALKYSPKEDKPIIYVYLANILSDKGDYKGCLKLLREKILETEEMYREPILLLRARAYLGLGQTEKAKTQTQKAFLASRKKRILHYMRIAAYLISSIYSAFGEEQKAKNNLKRYRKLLIRYKMNVAFVTWEIILGKKELPQGIEKHRVIKLALLLRKSLESKKERDFRKAYLYAKRRGLLGRFHRLCLLMPEPIRLLVEKGKPTGLPKAILRLPVFNKNIPVYNIKFLGNLVVYKNQRYLKIHSFRRKKSFNGVKLQPKDAAFLIHFALRAGEPGKKIILEDLYNNWWGSSKNPSKNLSHLLVRIKKALKIPTHLLAISYRRDNHVLINKGIYFTSDYSEFEQILTHAKALHRAEEWTLAKIEYKRAFSLFRGEPFIKMYDRWSENLRASMLNKLENEVLSFTKEFSSKSKKAEVEKLLEKAERIIPFSTKIKAIQL
ncbi:MAG: helix-turn-helix domain-containing protein [Candidatus Hodarchaeota archaeon]